MDCCRLGAFRDTEIVFDGAPADARAAELPATGVAASKLAAKPPVMTAATVTTRSRRSWALAVIATPLLCTARSLAPKVLSGTGVKRW
jgi:hypothetical protein